MTARMPREERRALLLPIEVREEFRLARAVKGMPEHAYREPAPRYAPEPDFREHPCRRWGRE